MSNPELIATLERAVVRLVQAPDPQAALNNALAYLIEAAGADMGAVFEPAGTSLRFTSGHGLPKKFLQTPPLLQRSAWEGAMIVSDPDGGPVDADLAGHAHLAGVQTWASLPVAYRDSFFGLLLVASRDLVGFSGQAVEIFSIVSRVLGLSLYGLRHAGPASEPEVERTLSAPAPTSRDR